MVTKKGDMSKPNFEDIEQLLGHSLDPGSAGTIRDLYDVPSHLIADARKLRSLTLSSRLLRHYTAESVWRWLPAFVDDVVNRGVDIASWLRGGILFPLFPLETLVTLQVDKILGVLQPAENEDWLQVAPDRDAWRIGERVAGAPAVARPELRYDSEPSDYTRRVLLNGLESLLKIEDISVTTRQWVASQIAARAARFGGVQRFGDPRSLLETVIQAVGPPSEDALIATHGVLRETRELGRSETEVPGFRGPAEWYR